MQVSLEQERAEKYLLMAARLEGDREEITHAEDGENQDLPAETIGEQRTTLPTPVQLPVTSRPATGETSNPSEAAAPRQAAVSSGLGVQAIPMIPFARVERDTARVHRSLHSLHNLVSQVYVAIVQTGEQVVRIGRDRQEGVFRREFPRRDLLDRDHPNRDLLWPRPILPLPPFHSVINTAVSTFQHPVAAIVFQINTTVSTFQHLVNTLGTPKDIPDLFNWEQGYMIDNPSKGESVDYNARVPFALGWASFEMNSFRLGAFFSSLTAKGDPALTMPMKTKKIVKRSKRKDLVCPTGESSHSQKPAEKTVRRADISAREDAAVDAEPLRSEKMVTLSDSAPSQKTATSADTVDRRTEEEDDAPSKALTAVNPEPVRENQLDLGVSAADSAEKIAKIKKRKRDRATVAERVEKKLRAMKVKNVSKQTGDADLQHIPRDKEVPDSDLVTPEAQIQGDNSISTVSLTTDEILDSIDVNKVDLINESLLIVLQQSEAEATGNKGDELTSLSAAEEER
ncbi:hypothetical protein KSP40_PGU001985 [Platanthera guangdongensis]|uniref:Uncharacterized protein n=1 Tax=Platanthera guangdongensis TaxID=2320717 RepID=A0ABR2MXU9_9ASPA